METKPSVPRAILVGIQVPSVDDVAHAASIEELGHLVKTLGYEVVGTMSQKRDAIPAHSAPPARYRRAWNAIASSEVGIDGHAAAPHVGLHAITGSGILTDGRSWSRFS